ncbi:MAG TPA: prepilin-type N-terminal cleavage/methylation domain-containing protein [Gemmatimonadales bacterium]|nr:prepilin-type N-terminal cleavage/methylation domain-containing protein [Gemmatimonadales bacterium]
MIRRSDAGWTLVELIIIMAIIGLLATIVIPRFTTTRDKALVATMKSDLRNLMTMEEARKVDSGTYVTSIPPTVWSPSAGVTGPSISLTADGWTASVGHVSSPRTCVIYVGSTPLAPAVNEGVPTCTP